jgi:serine/threonine-protein kinase ULK4
MIDLSRDTNEKVRRRAMAALGEFLFYGATQIDDDPSNTVWEMSTLAYNTLV